MLTISGRSLPLASVFSIVSCNWMMNVTTWPTHVDPGTICRSYWVAIAYQVQKQQLLNGVVLGGQHVSDDGDEQSRYLLSI